jgi:hypothetical protein
MLMTLGKQSSHAESTATGLVARAELLAAEINRIASEVDAVSVLNPMSILTLSRKCNHREILRPKVKTLLGDSLGAMRSPQSGPGFALGAIQSLSLGESLAATLLVQNQWQRLVGAIDRKSAFTVAVLSIYVSLVSIVTSACFGIATLP